MSDLVHRLRTHLKDYGAAVEAADRIEALEAALGQIMEHPAGLYEAQYDIARAALAPAPLALQRDKPAREENDDVFPGFRGNNDYA